MVREVALCREGRRVGAVTLRREGSRTEVRAAMAAGEERLCRAVLTGPGGELALGVLEPVAGELTICRRPYTRDVSALGEPLGAEVRPVGAFAPADRRWQGTDRPAALFHSSFLRRRLEGWDRAWWRREGDALLLALPLVPGRPFPLESLFCTARIASVGGQRCAVYTFGPGEEPRLPEA